MNFTEKQITFLKGYNIEATDENYAKLMEIYKAQKANKISDNELNTVSGGTSDNYYKDAMDFDVNKDYSDAVNNSSFQIIFDC